MAGGLGVILLQAFEGGLEGFQDLGAAPFLPIRLVLVQAQDIAPATLAITDEQGPAQFHAAQIILDLGDRGDIGGVAGKDPGSPHG